MFKLLSLLISKYLLLDNLLLRHVIITFLLLIVNNIIRLFILSHELKLTCKLSFELSLRTSILVANHFSYHRVDKRKVFWVVHHSRAANCIKVEKGKVSHERAVLNINHRAYAEDEVFH